MSIKIILVLKDDLTESIEMGILEYDGIIFNEMSSGVILVVYDFESKIYKWLIMNTHHSKCSFRLWKLMKYGTVSLCNPTDVEKWCQNVCHLLVCLRKRTDPTAFVSPT